MRKLLETLLIAIALVLITPIFELIRTLVPDVVQFAQWPWRGKCMFLVFLLLLVIWLKLLPGYVRPRRKRRKRTRDETANSSSPRGREAEVTEPRANGLLVVAILPLMFVGLLTGIWSSAQRPLLSAMGQTFAERRLYFSIEPGNYRLEPNLKAFFLGKWTNSDLRPIQVGFDIMQREIQNGELCSYYESLKEPDTAVQGLQQRCRDLTHESPDWALEPAARVEWQHACRFAEWLSDETHQVFRLPTVDEFYAAAAAAKPSRDGEIWRRADLSGARPAPVPRERFPGQLLDVFGNLREWTSTACSGGRHFVFGEDYFTESTAFAKEPLCRGRSLATTGFRLVRIRG